MLVSVILSSGLLYYYILTHSFGYAYVAHYSSLSLPLIYQISAFWAGQEGTFLLWSLFVAVLGMVLIRKQGVAAGVAPGLVSLYIAFLHLLMIVKSPFEVTSTVPADGQGMNPLLQDPWMAIHPPILFVGYAAPPPAPHRSRPGRPRAADQGVFSRLRIGHSMGAGWLPIK